MITQWSEKFSGPSRVITVSQNGGIVKCVHGLGLESDFSFAVGTRKEVNNPTLIEIVCKQAQHCQYILSVCTGSFVLQAAGLLNHRTVITHRNSIERLKQFNNLTVSEQRFIKDGHIWTSAGISAGIDMALAFIAEKAGTEHQEKSNCKLNIFHQARNISI